MLKKDNWQEREPVTDECHDRPDLGRGVIRNWNKIHLNVSFLVGTAED